MNNYLKEEEIKQIYEKFILPKQNEDFKYKYCPMPLYKNNKKWKWEKKDLPRIISLLEFSEFIENNNLFFEKALCINGSSDPEYEYVNCKTKNIIHYEDDPINNDLHNLNLKEKDYDFVMLNQTLEHVYDPIACLKNINNHLKTGSILYMNVPVNNIPHSTPFHYYTGFSPTGLGAITKISGYKILDIGFWGNKEYTIKMFQENNWLDYSSVSSFVNDFDYPLISWIFAKKL